MCMGQLSDGIEKGFATAIGNLIWSASVPAIIACSNPGYLWITILVVMAFSVGLAIVGISDLVSSSIGVLVGYGVVIAFVSQIDKSLFFEMALPYLCALLVLYLKSKHN